MKRKSSGLIQTHYGLACQQCGESIPGNEDWDWCDHITGHGCPWNSEYEYEEFDEYSDDEPPYPDQDPAAKLCKYCHKTIVNCICEHVDD